MLSFCLRYDLSYGNNSEVFTLGYKAVNFSLLVYHIFQPYVISEWMLAFVTQVANVSRMKHDNFVELLGYCVEGNDRILAYEFATMGSLHDILHG